MYQIRIPSSLGEMWSVLLFYLGALLASNPHTDGCVVSEAGGLMLISQLLCKLISAVCVPLIC